MVISENTIIGFIGTGVMGRSIAGHLLKAGYKLHVYNRTREKADGLVVAGAVWHDTPGEVASIADVIITIVGFPADVREIYLGENGIIANAREGSCLIDMTTSSPGLAKEIYEEAVRHSIHTLDAPVSGGDIGAREGRLSIMAGGDKEVFDDLLPIFELMGENIVYQGPAGSGQHTKMCNQIAIASGMLGVCEAMIYAKKSGLDPETVLKSISGGAAGSWSLSNLAPRIIQNNFDPGFYVKHFIKDMTIAFDEAGKMGLRVPGLQLAKELYTELADKGGEEYGTQGLFKLYDE